MNYEFFIPLFGVACFVLLLCLCFLNCFCKMRSRRVLSTHPNIYFTGNYPHMNCPQPSTGISYADMQQTSWTMHGGHASPPPSYSPNYFYGPRLTIPQHMPPGVTPTSPPPPYTEENSHPVFPQVVDVPKVTVQ